MLAFEELHRRLIATRADLEDVEYVNCGGCAVVAAYMAQALVTLGIPAEVVTPAWEWARTPAEALEYATANTNAHPCTNAAWDEAGLSRTHLAVRFLFMGDLYTWDTSGLMDGGRHFGVRGGLEYAYKEDMYPCPYPFGEGMDYRDALRIAQDPRGWNTTFDRDYIPHIIAAIESNMYKGEVHAV